MTTRRPRRALRDRLTPAQRTELLHMRWELPDPRAPFSTEAERRRAWREHAQELVSHHADRRPEAYWRYAPGVPDELRQMPPAPDPRPTLGTAPTTTYRREAAEYQRLQEARRAWLEGR